MANSKMRRVRNRRHPSLARVRSCLLITAFALAGCGGDEPDPPAPVPNRQPVFTSPATLDIAENRAGSIYQAAASDPDGDTVTYAISGGADQSRFVITTGGSVSFVSPPNFEAPTDADGDNVYRIVITASDGRATATLEVAITVTNSREGVVVRRVANGFSSPSSLWIIDESSALLAERTGAIYSIDLKTGARTLLIQVTNLGSAGVTAVAADPGFASNGAIFALYLRADGFLIVNQFVTGRSLGLPDPNFFSPLTTVPAPNYAGGGWLGFAADGMLLAATGDSSAASRAQDPSSGLGKVIRFRPNPDPFAGVSPVYFLTSVIANGLHQPVGGSRFGSDILLGDRGQTVAEEINLLSASNTASNFGWPFKEGRQAVQPNAPASTIDPVIEFPRGTGMKAGVGIIGGAIGSIVPESLRNLYVFADRNGAIFTARTDAIRQGTTLTPAMIERRDADFVPDQGRIDRPTGIVASPRGVLFIVDDDGEVFRVDSE